MREDERNEWKKKRFVYSGNLGTGIMGLKGKGREENHVSNHRREIQTLNQRTFVSKDPIP